MSGVGRRGGWGLGGGEGEDEALAGGILKRGVFYFIFFSFSVEFAVVLQVVAGWRGKGFGVLGYSSICELCGWRVV